MILDPETAYFVESYMAEAEAVPSNIDVEELSFDEVIVLSGAVPCEEQLSFDDRRSLNAFD